MNDPYAFFFRRVSVHEKIDILNERLEAAGGDKIDDGPQGSKASVSIKKCEYLRTCTMRVRAYPRVYLLGVVGVAAWEGEEFKGSEWCNQAACIQNWDGDLYDLETFHTDFN